MFSNTFQSGDAGVEIFSPAGNDPFKIMKLQNESSIGKIYERSVKGYMITLDKESNVTCIQCPQKQKDSLGISQSLLVFQIFFAASKSFSLEVVVIDTNNQRRRLHLSSNFTVFDSNGLHCRIPWESEKGTWMNLVFDLVVMVDESFKGEVQFQSLESFTIHPVCRIRKIFTLPRKSFVDTDNVLIPSGFDFPPGVEHLNTVYKILNSKSSVKPEVSSKHNSALTTTVGGTQNGSNANGHHNNSSSRNRVVNKKLVVMNPPLEPSKDIISMLPATEHSVVVVNKPTLTVPNDFRIEHQPIMELQSNIITSKMSPEPQVCLDNIELLLNRATTVLRGFEVSLSRAEEAYITKHGRSAFKLEVDGQE